MDYPGGPDRGNKRNPGLRQPDAWIGSTAHNQAVAWVLGRPILFIGRADGEVAEWLKAHAWNACRRATVSRVRIPPSPPPGPRESVFPIRLRANFSVVFEGYAAGAVHRLAQKIPGNILSRADFSAPVDTTRHGSILATLSNPMVSVDSRLSTSTTGAACRVGREIEPSPMKRCVRKISRGCLQKYFSHSVWRRSPSPISMLGAPVASHETSAAQVAVTWFSMRRAHSHTVAARHPSSASAWLVHRLDEQPSASSACRRGLGAPPIPCPGF